MTDTELILSKIDELRTELKGDIAVLDTKINELHTELKKLNDKLEFIEYGLQREIESTYDLATENAEKIGILMADREKARKRRAKLRLISDYRR